MSLSTELMAEYEAAKEAEKKGRKPLSDIEWSAPVPFDEYTLPPFPIEIFPEWLAEYVKGVAESTQTPVDAPGISINRGME